VIAFTIDTTPPAVTLTSGPTATSNNSTPTFGGAVGTAAGDTGSVTLDVYSGTSATGTPVQAIAASVSGGSWSATTAALADGTYTARAAQSDAAGNQGQSAKRTFTIDTVSPDTSIISGPPSSTTSTSATFVFSSSKAGSTFQCRLDGGAWGGCSTPKSYSGLTVGSHSFAVRAIDAYGNTDPSPATNSWTITSPPPTGTTPTGTPGSPPPTITKVQITLTAKARQRLSRRGQLRLQVRCAQACSLLLSGKLAAVVKGHPPHALTIRRILNTKLAGSTRVGLTIKLSAKARRSVARALAHRQRVTLTVSALATAPGLQSGAARVIVRLVH
jgi:hypothetical protein